MNTSIILLALLFVGLMVAALLLNAVGENGKAIHSFQEPNFSLLQN